MSQNHALLKQTLSLAPVVPVLIINDLASAVPMAQALVAGGLPVLEITLRTPVALAAMEAMAKVEGAIVGAGTVRDAGHIKSSIDAGAQFMVSPGISPKLLEAADDVDVPLLPGATSASEVMALAEHGYKYMKFFPAEAMGGAPVLKAIGAPLPDIMFCPTGGIGLGNARDYLSLSNVICVGGSWVAPNDAVAAGDWSRVETLAREAAGLAG